MGFRSDGISFCRAVIRHNVTSATDFVIIKFSSRHISTSKKCVLLLAIKFVRSLKEIKLKKIVL